MTVTVQGISLQQLGQPVAEVVGRVSVVTPLNRRPTMMKLWHCCSALHWWTCDWNTLRENLTVGTKRNLTILLGSDQFIVNFDDSDVYNYRSSSSKLTM